MNFDFIVDGLENFANWGDPIADIFGALGDIFGDKGLGALVEADEGEETSLADLSSGSSSSDPDTTPEPTPDPDTTPEPTPSDN